MKVKALVPFLDDNGMHNQGDVFEVSDLRARELESKKQAVPLVNQKDVAALKGAASKGAARPTPAPLTGGRIGEVKPVSSSPQAPVPPKRNYTRRRASPK